MSVEGKGGWARGVLFLLLGALALWGVIATLRVGALPAVTITPELPAIGEATPVRIVVEAGGRGLSHVGIELVQGDRVESLADRSYRAQPAWKLWGSRPSRAEIRLEVGRKAIPALRPGRAVIRVTVSRAPTWLRRPEPVVVERELPVRLEPPALAVLSTQNYAAQGGAGVVVYRVGHSSVRDGVEVGSWFFAGSPLPDGAPGERFAFYGIPYDLEDGSAVRLFALDDVGNRAQAAFIDRFFKKPFKKDTIPVTEAFMSKVVPEILSRTPDLVDKGSLLANFLEINRKLRTRDAAELVRLSQRSAAKFLWSEPFLPMPNAKVMSAFADRRTYLHDGAEIDGQDHLGFDLAVTRQAPVPAGNEGVVVLARYFGIYGNAVVIDHGYGVQSLYGHLSSIDVREGAAVKRGEIIGRTGQTGLAGGDHLHFSVLVHGLPVNAREWWDAHWIRDRIAAKLAGALRFETGG